MKRSLALVALLLFPLAPTRCDAQELTLAYMASDFSALRQFPNGELMQHQFIAFEVMYLALDDICGLDWPPRATTP